MKVVFTEPALEDLRNIRDYTTAHYPRSLPDLGRRINDTLTRIGTWPEAARELDERPSVRMVPLRRYPFNIYYRIGSEAVEVLHIYHDARQLWDSE